MCSIPFSLNDHSEPFAFSLPLSDDLTQIIFFLYAAPSVTLIHTMSERPSRGTWRFNVFVQRWSVFYKVWAEKKNGFKGKKKVSQFEDVFQPGVAKTLGLLAFISWFFLFNCWTVHEEGGEEAEGFSVYDTKQTLNWCKIKQSIICKVFYKVEVKSPRSYSFGRCLYYKHRPKTSDSIINYKKKKKIKMEV